MSELLPAGNGTIKWIGRAGQFASPEADCATALLAAIAVIKSASAVRHIPRLQYCQAKFLQVMASASRKLSNSAVRNKNFRASSGFSAVRRSSS
jgi:hypothetical protein